MVLLEQIAEAIYFAMFLLIGKDIKEKRLLFIGTMIFEYLALKHFIEFNVWFQLIYTFMSFVNLKVFYKEKAQITDVFLFAVSSIILIVFSAFSYSVIYFTVKILNFAYVLNICLMISFFVLCRKKIKSLYRKFCSLWNRHNNPHMIKSLTLRNISIITFNLMFWFINLGMIFCIMYLK